MTQPTDKPTTSRVKPWYLTAPNHKLSWVNGETIQIPYGVAHVRSVGGARTACGIAARYWPIYWLLELSDAEDLCHDCEIVAIRNPALQVNDNVGA